MTLEQNIKGICSKFGLDFNEFLKDFEVDHVMEMSLFDLEAICEEYEIDLHTLLFKAVFFEASLKKKLEDIKLLILDVDVAMASHSLRELETLIEKLFSMYRKRTCFEKACPRTEWLR